MKTTVLPPVIDIRNVYQRFTTQHSSITAIDGISFTAQHGEIIALLGPNGAGKTTLIDMILGLATPAEGTVLINGKSPATQARAGYIGAIFQEGGLLKDSTVEQTVLSLAALYPRPIDTAAVIEQAQLTKLRKHKVGALSGGEQQRLRYALATMHQPQLLILDEPTAAMDVNARQAFWASMERVAASGITIIFATHYLEEAQNFAQRIVMLNRGTIIADGSPEDLRSLAGAKHMSFYASDTIALPQVEIIPEGAGYRHKLTSTEVEKILPALLAEHRISDLEIIKPTLDETFTYLVAESNRADSNRTASK
ncbi:MAG: ABC transporter ATP-binding protein [Rothia sp. (in: high G+C Gram-positive bacteria)]|uniref:ABC transporter ATP-binding protein n=1 Tax=Rothia sp. (in: high G+C Gram-positive bacteria) TaxID=1885016 RepID=UPI0026E0D401|nr:ABC transporter ATP-binding protein [Rothia sp. (in: high G+C Gram-positive bacteria)]MDO5750054.1 ABC transporter ATP-binding protein [Rothia sp. (in: high G+C Gram-positive bacteria)]